MRYATRGDVRRGHLRDNQRLRRPARGRLPCVLLLDGLGSHYDVSAPARWGRVVRRYLVLLLLVGCGGAAEAPSSAEAQANTACIDRGDADIPTATVQASDAESACLAAQCIPNVQCGDPGKTTCVFVHGVHGQEGIWDCPIGCCY